MNFIALDVETTGILSYTDRIVELAAVRFKDGKKEDSFSTLINPGIAITEEASRVNGITNEMLKDQPNIAEVLSDFSLFCEDHVLVAHNATFDFQFLCAALEECYCAGPRGPLFDTYLLSKKTFPGLSNYKLSTIVEYLKIPASHFHRAEQDAWSCGQVFNIILNRIKPLENGYFDFSKLNKITGKKELRFPALKAHQLSLFE